MELKNISFHTPMHFINGGISYRLDKGLLGVIRIVYHGDHFKVEVENGDVLLIPSSSVAFGRYEDVNNVKTESSKKRTSKKK